MMDNMERIWVSSTDIVKDHGKIETSNFADGVCCFVTDKKYLYLLKENPSNEYSYCNSLLSKVIELKFVPVYIQYLSFYDKIFVATEYKLFMINCTNSEINECHHLDKKLISLSWNPTQTSFVIICEDYEIIFFTFTGNALKQELTSSLNVTVPNSLYVGWGSAETQFKGIGKGTKTQDGQAQVDYTNPQVSWRSNGEQFVVNFYTKGVRRIKVFDAETVNALYESPTVINLKYPVSFMGQGQSIVSFCSNEKGNKLVFFEKNCKIKSLFTIPDSLGWIPQQILCHPQWNNTLAVSFILTDGSACIYIYICSNTKWYLKQAIPYSSICKIKQFQWIIMMDQAINTICKIAVITEHSVDYFTYRFITNRCPGTTITAAVDGKMVHFYNFSSKITPPPIKYYSIENNKPINLIIFHHTGHWAGLIDLAFHIFIIDIEKKKKISEISHKFILNLSIVSYFSAWDQVNSNQINIYLVKTLSGHSPLQAITKDGNNTFSLKIQHTNKNIFPINDSNSLDTFKYFPFCYFPNLIYLTKYLVDIDEISVKFEFSLNSNRELYINDSLACQGVVSFFIFKKYLVFTHVSCKLYCINFEVQSKLLLDTFCLEKMFSREIEQGSRIVCNTNSVPPKIVLQQPRGNLELVSCRLITVYSIETLLENNDWATAIEIITMERINWNILIDLHPDRFCQNIDKFIKAVKNSFLLNTIVSEFNNENSCATYCIASSPCDKVDIVKKIVLYLFKEDPVNNLQSVVAILQKHCSLRCALIFFKKMYNCDSLNKYLPLYVKILKNLLIHDNLHDILDVSYTFCNLGFLKFIYENSGEDPRAYEPIIKGLGVLDSFQLKFKMNLIGRRYKNAVKYLLRCEEMDEDFIKNFIVSNNLENEAYYTIHKNHNFFKLVSRLYAKKISLKQLHMDAAVILKRAELLDEAIIEYEKASDWKEVISIMITLKYDELKKRYVLENICDKLINDNNINDATIVLEHYIGDNKRALKVLMDHKQFRNAISIAKTYNMGSQVENEIISAIKLYMEIILEKIQYIEEKFAAYANRLQVVRNKKKMDLENPHYSYYQGEDDLFSETSSVKSSQGSSRATSKSRKSTMSSRNRKKEEKKKINLRQGGFYEDIALIRAIYQLFVDVNDLGNEVREMCLITEHQDFCLAAKLHKNLEKLQCYMKGKISEVWPIAFLNNSYENDATSLALVQNKKELDPIFWTPPHVNTLWKVEMFK